MAAAAASPQRERSCWPSMKPTATNAPRPTAASIFRFFQLSHKRHLLLTGTRGSGKTTLLNELLPLLSEEPIPGITTQAIPKQAVFLRESLTGASVPIGKYHAELPGAENKMLPLNEGFLSLGLSALEKGMRSPSRWFSMDEIGYLETSCAEYCQGIQSLMEHKQLIAVVRKQNLPFLTELSQREDVCLIDLDHPFPDAGCVIMASGLGKRFGRNKLMANFLGKPMIAWILDSTENLFAKRVVVTRYKDVETLCRQRGIDVILHKLPHRSDTVRLGMEAMDNVVSSCMFCPGDQPLLSAGTLQTMLLACKQSPEHIWQLSYKGTPASPLLFPQWAFEALRHLPEGKGGNLVAKKHAQLVRFVPALNPAECCDVDSPEDLTRLAESLIGIK